METIRRMALPRATLLAAAVAAAVGSVARGQDPPVSVLAPRTLPLPTCEAGTKPRMPRSTTRPPFTRSVTMALIVRLSPCDSIAESSAVGGGGAGRAAFSSATMDVSNALLQAWPAAAAAGTVPYTTQQS